MRLDFEGGKMNYLRESEKASIFVQYCQEVIDDQEGGKARNAKGQA